MLFHLFKISVHLHFEKSRFICMHFLLFFLKKENQKTTTTTKMKYLYLKTEMGTGLRNGSRGSDSLQSKVFTAPCGFSILS